jgi:signal transduction histidine kinase
MAASLDAATREIHAQSAARIAAQEQLRHADRLTTVGKLASGLAHELGTPLNVVAGRARMIAEEEVASAGEAVECARIIVAQADRMTGIVRQLLDFARRRGGERHPTNLSELTAQAAALLRPLAAKRGVAIEVAPVGPPIRGNMDPTQIQQAVMNLLMNAVQASTNGQAVRLAARAEEGTNPRTGLRSRHAVLEVADEGAGIPPENLEQIFDPFFTTKAPGDGTGLGLSVAHGIAEDHGGWIDAESHAGRGSCFRIWLPLEAA